jgi:hypothetical protein
MPHDTDNMKVYPLKDLAALKAYAKHHHDHEIEFLEIRKRAEAEIMEAHDKHRSAMRCCGKRCANRWGSIPIRPGTVKTGRLRSITPTLALVLLCTTLTPLPRP